MLEDARENGNGHGMLLGGCEPMGRFYSKARTGLHSN
jgi:hypothetical protein